VRTEAPGLLREATVLFCLKSQAGGGTVLNSGTQGHLVRDVVQIISVIICGCILFAVYWRGRRYGEQAREWYTFIFIAVITIGFYLFTFIDLYWVNLGNGSDVSSMVRLASLIALLIYISYNAPRRSAP
jgi:hypothetical protein